MSAVSMQSAKPAWRAAIVLLTIGDAALLGHHDVGVDERVGADEALDRRRRGEAVAGDQRGPLGVAAGQVAGERHRAALADRRCRTSSAIDRPHGVPAEHVAVREVERPAGGGRRRRRPHAAPGRRGRRRRPRAACGGVSVPGEVQRLAGRPLQRGVGGDRRQRVHVDVARWPRTRRSGGRSSGPSRPPPGGPGARPPAASRSSGARPAAPARGAAAGRGRGRSRVGARRRPWCPAAARRAAARSRSRASRRLRSIAPLRSMSSSSNQPGSSPGPSCSAAYTRWVTPPTGPSSPATRCRIGQVEGEHPDARHVGRGRSGRPRSTSHPPAAANCSSAAWPMRPEAPATRTVRPAHRSALEVQAVARAGPVIPYSSPRPDDVMYAVR